MGLYIILVNYNSSSDTIDCVYSLLKSTIKDFCIIIVDNSDDESHILKIKEVFQHEKIILFNETDSLHHELNENKIICIKQNENKGFASANNLGIDYVMRQDQKNAILLLNNDTIVEENAIENLINEYKQRGQNNCYTGKIFYYDNRNYIWYDGGAINYLTGKVKHIGFNRLGPGNNTIKKTDFITFCYVLIPINVIKKIGKLNEGYFMYYEDVDYCYKCKKNSIPMIQIPSSVIYHKVGMSSGGSLSEFSAYYSYKNEIRFNLQRSDVLKYLSLLIIITKRLVIALRWLLRGKKKFSYISLITIKDALRNVR